MRNNADHLVRFNIRLLNIFFDNQDFGRHGHFVGSKRKGLGILPLKLRIGVDVDLSRLQNTFRRLCHRSGLRRAMAERVNA